MFFFFFDPVFSQRLTLAMEKRNVGVKQLSARTGVSPVTINRWLRGSYNPRYDNQIKVADALGVPECYLSGRDEHQQTELLSGQQHLPYLYVDEL